ncbi:hypothetical protein GGU10DRAFT_386993 [Lentinula aff. detonsa]|uniref:Uncharacterized protein n=1 Tax=Lentinula aff. detonsa TaxID=2804958 RepID=A0AA38KF20_9AGAR|nr:hypothetical protein GGU10DRAFT_386993 [Lentinula aff. detonsa]
MIYPAGIDEQYFMVHHDFLDPLLSEEYMDSLGDITFVQVKENSRGRTTSEVERTAKRSRTSISQGLNGYKRGSRSRRSTNTKLFADLACSISALQFSSISTGALLIIAFSIRIKCIITSIRCILIPFVRPKLFTRCIQIKRLSHLS